MELNELIEQYEERIKDAGVYQTMILDRIYKELLNIKTYREHTRTYDDVPEDLKNFISETNGQQYRQLIERFHECVITIACQTLEVFNK